MANQFLAGDFVWCKIDNSTHPWWPGQIHKREDASNSAMTMAGRGWHEKARNSRRVLVALFGNGSFSWSVPGQEIVPFAENFRAICSGEMSRDFIHAVNEAVDGFTRAVDLGLTCRCVGRDGMTRPVVVNDGVKEGVLAPEVDVERLAVPSAPDLLSILGKVATQNECVPSAWALEIGRMRGYLSAFYRPKGINTQLLEYQEPYVIEGLEDQSSDKGKTIVLAEEDKSVSIAAGSDEDEEKSLLSSDVKFSQAADVRGSSSVGGNSKQKQVAEITETTPDLRSRKKGRTPVKKKSLLLSSLQKQPAYVMEDQSSDKGKTALVDPAAVYSVGRSRTGDLVAEEDVGVSPSKRQKRAGSAKDDDEKYQSSSDMMKKKVEDNLAFPEAADHGVGSDGEEGSDVDGNSKQKTNETVVKDVTTTTPTPDDEMNKAMALSLTKTPEAVKGKGKMTTAIETTPTADANNPLSELRKIRKELEVTDAVLEKYHKLFPDIGNAILMEQLEYLTKGAKAFDESVRMLAEKTPVLSRPDDEIGKR